MNFLQQKLELTAIGNIEAYIRFANQQPMLTAEQEFSLAERLQKNHDIDAARQLVLSHLRLVISTARGYLGYGLPLNDLIQEGNVGLMKAVKKFDPSKGVRLVSFAIHWIKAELHEYIIKNWRVVKIATTKAQRKLFFNLRKMTQQYQQALTQQEQQQIASSLEVDVADVVHMEQRMNCTDVAFDPMNSDEEMEHLLPSHRLADNRYTPVALLEQQEAQKLSAELLPHALEQLDDRSRLILEKRWLCEEKATLEEVAELLGGLSAERVRQLENNAIKKLKESILMLMDSAA